MTLADVKFTLVDGAGFILDTYAVEQARRDAIKFHSDQMYGEAPYIVHLDAVSRILLEFGYTGARLHVAAYFHDAAEDTELTYWWLIMNYGRQVSNVVEHVTDPEGMSRKERKAFINSRLLSIDESTFLADALIIKMADRLANVRASKADNPKLFKMYHKEMPAFLRAVYRPGVGVALYSALASYL